MKTVVVGITSSIAGYKALDLVKNLKKENIDVCIIMTRSAEIMFGKEIFQKASGNTVRTKLFTKKFDCKKVLESKTVDHVLLAKKADLFVVAPATANVIGKLANGLADDFLTTVALATTAPIIICPAMNTNMWMNSIVQENVDKLKSRGVIFIYPEKGNLACGDEGVGRLTSIKKIKEEIFCYLQNTTELKGKKIIVTAGATIAPIDDVRFITNRSSGKMGAALADACYLNGASVIYLGAKTAVRPRYPVEQYEFETPDELYRLIKKHAAHADMIFHTAAVSDFAPKKHFNGKISSEKSVNLKLVPQKKIINEIKKINTRIFVIAFKAVFQKSEIEMIQIGKKKISAIIDAVIVNDVGKENCGFAVDTNEVTVVQRNKKPVKIPLASKREIARKIINVLSS